MAPLGLPRIWGVEGRMTRRLKAGSSPSSWILGMKNLGELCMIIVWMICRYLDRPVWVPYMVPVKQGVVFHHFFPRFFFGRHPDGKVLVEAPYCFGRYLITIVTYENRETLGCFCHFSTMQSWLLWIDVTFLGEKGHPFCAPSICREFSWHSQLEPSDVKQIAGIRPILA